MEVDLFGRSAYNDFKDRIESNADNRVKLAVVSFIAGCLVTYFSGFDSKTAFVASVIGAGVSLAIDRIFKNCITSSGKKKELSDSLKNIKEIEGSPKRSHTFPNLSEHQNSIEQEIIDVKICDNLYAGTQGAFDVLVADVAPENNANLSYSEMYPLPNISAKIGIDAFRSDDRIQGVLSKVDEAIKSKKRVLIFCPKRGDLGAFVIAAYLIEKRKLSKEDMTYCLKFIKQLL